TAAMRAGIAQSAAMARSAQVLVIFSAVIIGVEAIGLDVDFLSTLIVVIAGTLFAGASLAFSLGARSMVANLLGAQASRKHCRLGETLRIGDIEGVILEITQTSILLDTPSGRAVVPAKLFHEKISEQKNQQAAESDNESVG
ncbi:MAG: mechanosensitive ion channel, partial [Gammaproteobacteria bacterium]